MLVSSIFTPSLTSNRCQPLFLSQVPAGFPSPADDYMEGSLDLNTHLIKHPSATFFVRAIGDSMKNAGIYTGDILIVDRSLEAVDNTVVIAVVNGELTVKRLKKESSLLSLVSDNDEYAPIPISEDMDFSIWGVVTTVIHEF
ncbi:MAG: translesion error-prone DNA polymerase V autoproteolytic subunit [Candidatus Latescibacterota bacterium]